ncbi:MAG: hypothetical protein DRI52_08210 [Chloroflexi bacterium]|nr:MAG: hypothetical protein DRI52_08210 [Chloroflexota bacterium]
MVSMGPCIGGCGVRCGAAGATGATAGGQRSAATL